MNTFVRTGDSKKSLNLGIQHFRDRVGFIEFTHFKKAGQVLGHWSPSGQKQLIGRRSFDATEFDSDMHHPLIRSNANENFFRNVFLLAQVEARHDLMAIQFRTDALGNLSFNKDEIQIIKHLMGFDPSQFHAVNPKLSLAYKK